MAIISNQNNYLAVETSPITCADLFCGAGGLTLGFCQAGGRPIAAVDNDKKSIETYTTMFPMCNQVFMGDIESWDTRLSSSPDVVIGGPPCQGFSLARGFRFVDDPRNHLYKWFVEFVRITKPSWVVMENVPGITNIGKGIVLQQIYEDFRRVGYDLDHKVINMARYGVPQTRTRAIFVGNRNGTRFNWPEPTHTSINDVRSDDEQLFAHLQEPYVSVGQALGDLPWPLGKYIAHRANSKMRGPRNRLVEKDPAFTLRVRGDEFAFCDKPAEGAFAPGPVPDVEPLYQPVQNKFQEMMREEAPPWLADYEPFSEKQKPIKKLKGNRRLSVREQARLQTFPDWFSFSGTPYAQGRQIGNAVPPLFARELFRKIIDQLNQSK